MPNNRKGKWQPFDALSGFRTSLDEVNYQKEKISKPILSIDELEQINQTLQIAINEEQKVLIKFFKDGYIYEESGLINKVDLVFQKIHINGAILEFRNILDIQII